VENNPLRYTDPSGHCPACAEIALHLLLWLLERDLRDGRFDTPTDIRTTVVTTKDVLAGNPLGQYRDQNLSAVLPNQSGSTAPDVTAWLVDTMNTNASGSIAATLSNANAGNPAEKYAAYLGWAALVKGEGPWDFKADFRELDIDTVILGGHQFNMDVVANIHYGFVGAASGFSTEELLVGAGLAQIKAGTTDWTDWGYWTANFDDPKDQNAIFLGIWLYQQYGPELTVEQFTNAIEGYRENLRQAK